MADSARASVVVGADPDAVMAVIADFESYPQWAGFLRSAEVLERGEDGRARRVRFLLDAGAIKDDYVLAYAWDGDAKVAWHLESARVQKSQTGSYTLVGTAGGTHVTYELAVELNVPMLGMFKRKAEKMIMDTALKELQRRVEQP